MKYQTATIAKQMTTPIQDVQIAAPTNPRMAIRVMTALAWRSPFSAFANGRRLARHSVDSRKFTGMRSLTLLAGDRTGDEGP
jgi:hypothetical protein